MICPCCGGVTKVVDSRANKDTVVRRRQCLSCNKLIKTKEIIITDKEYRQVENDYLKELKSLKENVAWADLTK